MDPKTGLYSKAAKIIRQYPDAQASAEDMIGFARNKGVKPVEIERLSPAPTGAMDREELARMFEQNVPKVRAVQYGSNPRYVSPQEGSDYNWMSNRQVKGQTLTPEEKARFDELHLRQAFRPHIVDQYDEDTGEEGEAEPGYRDYTLPGGKDYRERLLTLADSRATELDRAKMDYERAKQNHDFYAPRYENNPDSPMMAQHRQRLQEAEDRLRELRGRNSEPENFISSHWRDHPNVLAHIRMSDRDVGGKRLLHVEELQSDWGQEGRDKGFYDPQKPVEVFHTGTGKTVHATDDLGEAKRMAEKLGPEYDYGYVSEDKVPTGPYVTNTQHWTDLALKNVLREAAVGNYDGVIFTPGQAQFDRYPDGTEDEREKRLQGMKSYYDKRVPESITKLAQMHDPAAAPAEPVDLGGYQGFHLPITEKMRQSIISEGFPAYRRGGSVDSALSVTRRFTKDGAGAMMRLGVKE